MTELNGTITIVVTLLLMGIAHAVLILRQGTRLDKRIDDSAIRSEKRIDDLAIRLEKRIDDLAIRLDKRIDDGNRRNDEVSRAVSALAAEVAKLDSRISKLEGLIEVGLLQFRPAKPQFSDTPTGEEVSDQPSQAVARRTPRNPE